MIKVNRERVKKAFENKNITMASADRILGLTKNRISACLHSGGFTEDELERICILLNVKLEDLEEKESKEPEKSYGGVNQSDTDKIISYICDIGKIQTDMLRELKELHNNIKELLTAVNTNILDGNTENHGTAENIKNFAVATNQNLNKIHNLMKYGGK